MRPEFIRILASRIREKDASNHGLYRHRSRCGIGVFKL
jgi:hypothetical protein